MVPPGSFEMAGVVRREAEEKGEELDVQTLVCRLFLEKFLFRVRILTRSVVSAGLPIGGGADEAHPHEAPEPEVGERLPLFSSMLSLPTFFWFPSRLSAFMVTEVVRRASML